MNKYSSIEDMNAIFASTHCKETCPGKSLCNLMYLSRVIVNKKERRLKKGSGFHLDLFIIGILNGFCGVFGLPFMTAATVRSVTHVSALTVFSKTHAPGEKPKLLEVKEQRLTNFLVHVLIGKYMLINNHFLYLNCSHFTMK